MVAAPSYGARRRLLLGILGTMAGIAAGCGLASPQAEDADDPSRRPVVVTDFSILADFAAVVAGDRMDVVAIVPRGADPHVHEPRPSDAVRIAEADLVLEHGLGLSPWMGPLLANAVGPVVTVGEVVAEHAVRDDTGVLDPHLWMVPPLAAEYTAEIARAMASVDPDGADAYLGNAQRHHVRLADLDAELQAAFRTIPPQHRKLVTPHDAYRYFAEHFGLEVLGTLVGVTTEEEPSARRVRELVDAVRGSGVPAVFVESTVPPAQIERVAAEAGVAVAGPIYGDSVGEPGSAAEDYFGMMRTNARTIVEALGGRWP